RDDDRKLAGLEPLLGVEPEPARHAAVVRRDLPFPEPRLELVRDALDQAARVDEDDRRPLAPDVRGDAVVDLGPELVGRDRTELLVGDLDRQLERAPVADVDDRARPAAGQEPRDLLDRALRRRETDPLETPSRERVEPLEAERQVRAALVAGDGVDLVDDHGPRAGEEAPAPF